MRKRFIKGCSVLGGLLSLSACAISQAQAPLKDLFYIGSNGTEFSAASFDPKIGVVEKLGVVAKLGKPTWAVRNPRLPILYVSDQAGDGRIMAYHMNAKDGALRLLGEVPVGSPGPTHLWFDANSNTLLTANYGGGSIAAIGVKDDGTFIGAVSLVKMTGSGPNARQATPHVHGVGVDPSGRYVLASDLGTDKLYVYPLDQAAHRLVDEGTASRHLNLPAGSGPRHFAFNPNGRYLYLLGELTGQIFVVKWDAQSGTATLVQTISANAPDFTGASSVSTVAVSRDGRFLYVGNRGDSSVVVLSIADDGASVSPIQRMASGGVYPWDFRLNPSGEWLVVANERSNNLAVFAVDRATGMLRDSGQRLDVEKPVSVTFSNLR